MLTAMNAESSSRCLVMEPWVRSFTERSSGPRLSWRPSSVAQEVAGVSVRVLAQIVLVILLGRPEVRRRDDLGDDRPRPLPRCLDARLDGLGRPPLLLARVED